MQSESNTCIKPRTYIEALPGGYLFPCSPEINWLVLLFPKNRKFVFMFPVPQYCLCSPVPLEIWPMLPCSPEINALFPLFPKTPGRPYILGKCMIRDKTYLLDQNTLVQEKELCWALPQVTNRPMYNIASAVTCRSLAIVWSLPLPLTVSRSSGPICWVRARSQTRQKNCFGCILKH